MIPRRSQLEESTQIEVSVFQDFDYVALGHIHSPQNVGSNQIRYCGTPLKYSFSEAGTAEIRDCSGAF